MYRTRILLITPYFYPHKGGSQAYAEELHYNLMKLDPTVKVDVLCYNTDHAPDVEEHRGFTIYRVPCVEILPGQFALPNYVTLWHTLNKLFAKNHYTFINSHTRFFESSWWVPVVARYFHTKAVLTDHCAYHPTHSSQLVTHIARFIDRYLIPLVINHYDLVTVTNQATKDFLINMGIANTQIIYGGVDTRLFMPQRKISKKILPHIARSLPKHAILVSFVGRMIPSKGPQLLLQAAKKTIKHNPHVYFAFAGTGPLYTELSRYASKNIMFLGSCNKREVAKLLTQTDILINPSLHHEGFPNVLLEASSAGCAIATTNRGGTYEIIQDKENGLFIQPTVQSIQKALSTLIINKKMRETLSSHARNMVVSRYDWKKVTRGYHAFIERSVKNPLVISSLQLTATSAPKTRQNLPNTNKKQTLLHNPKAI